jgi:hypothetical protein
MSAVPREGYESRLVASIIKDRFDVQFENEFIGYLSLRFAAVIVDNEA